MWLFTFAIGHFALGYMTGRGSSKIFGVRVNLPLLLTVSVLPDIDLILRFLHHRGQTHSLITFAVFLIPLLLYYGKGVLPYFAALLSHSLIGDFFTGGVELFWPISNGWYGINVSVTSMANVSAELILFAMTLALMFKTGDFHQFTQSDNHNHILIIALGAVVGPMFQLGRGCEQALPSLLVAPSLFYVAIFVYSLYLEAWTRLNRHAVLHRKS